MKRALLIGGSTHERIGIGADLDLIDAVLREYGFTCITRRSGGTTRQVILDALRAFAEQVEADDVAVVYYTGHGGVARFDGEIGGEVNPLRNWRYLVPEVDSEFHSARTGKFAGVLDVELGEILGELGRRCPNLTVIFECCFAGGMLAIPPKRRGRGDVHTFAVPEDLRGEATWSRRHVGALQPLESAWSSPIVIAAVREGDKSYELSDKNRNGVFTWALAETLRATKGAAIAWGSLLAMVGLRIKQELGPLGLAQQPLLVGPRGRRVFGTETHDTACEFEAVVGTEGRVRLMAGTLHALREGDTLDLLDPVSRIRLVRARIASAEPVRALLEPSAAIDRPPWSTVIAVLSARAKPTPVRIVGESPLLTELRSSVVASAWLCEANSEAEDPDELELRVDDDRLRLTGRGIHRLSEPEDIDEELPDRAARLAEELAAIARARGFERACAELDEPPETIDFWLRANNPDTKQSRVLALAGATLELQRERVDAGMRFVEDYTGETKVVSLVNVGLDGLAYILRSDSGTSADLCREPPGETEGTERAIALSWPARVPREPTSETFYFVVTAGPAGLESICVNGPEVRRCRPAPDLDVTLEQLFAPVDAWVQPMTITVCPGPT